MGKEDVAKSVLIRQWLTKMAVPERNKRQNYLLQCEQDVKIGQKWKRIFPDHICVFKYTNTTIPEHNLFKSLKLPACEDQRVKGNQSTHK